MTPLAAGRSVGPMVHVSPAPSGRQEAPDAMESAAGRRSVAVTLVAGEGPALDTRAERNHRCPACTTPALRPRSSATSAWAVTVVTSVWLLFDRSRSSSAADATKVNDNEVPVVGVTPMTRTPPEPAGRLDTEQDTVVSAAVHELVDPDGWNDAPCGSCAVTEIFVAVPGPTMGQMFLLHATYPLQRVAQRALPSSPSLIS